VSVVLRARGLSVGYGRDAVLRGIDLDVCGGERWFLLGPNGSGKTTLLRTLLGVLPPVAGRIELLGTVGYFPQIAELMPHVPLTVAEFVGMGLVGSTLPRARLEPTLAEVGLAESGGRSVFALSGGQRSRAFLGRALVRAPDLLILDEPTAQLDEAGEAGFYGVLAGRRDVACVVATHRRHAAERWASHLLHVREGTARVEVRS